ncbi:hypothetical protein H4V99_003341 [Cryobacterium sp. CG_9.6]|nr:hypothetical protein [Cryobacterium sp. CG_9.6]
MHRHSFLSDGGLNVAGAVLVLGKASETAAAGIEVDESDADVRCPPDILEAEHLRWPLHLLVDVSQTCVSRGATTEFDDGSTGGSRHRSFLLGVVG